MSPELSIIIPCYNAESTLAETLGSLCEQRWDRDWEVVFADNACTDRSREMALGFADSLPSLKVVDASRIQGQPYALNEGVANACGRSVAFCDADDVPAPGWVAAIGAALEKHEFVACRMDFEKLNPPWLAASRSNVQAEGLPKIKYPPYLPHAGGGTLGIRRNLCLELGGFDQSLPYLHDTDFCFRLGMAGFAPHFVPDAVMHIRMRPTPARIFQQAVNYGEYNMILAKRYRNSAPPRPKPWRRFLRKWQKTLTAGLHSPRDLSRQASFAWCLGWQLGIVKGIAKHRAVPY